jgi:hypothetical protein
LLQDMEMTHEQKNKQMLEQEHAGSGGMTPVAKSEEKLFVKRSSCRIRS